MPFPDRMFSNVRVPFNQPYYPPTALPLVAEAVTLGSTGGDGVFCKRAERWLDDLHELRSPSRSLLTPSCSSALELCARLIGLRPGDEVIVPSFAFVTTASAFLFNGATPVFADVRGDTFNLDVSAVERALTPNTRAVCAISYGGVGAEMVGLSELCRHRDLVLVEDNAHGLGGSVDGKVLGTYGHLSTLSFHETKNVTCGEGGALVVNAAPLVDRAEILREKGTDRSQFLRGQIDKYTWREPGASWVLSDLLGAILCSQFDDFHQTSKARTGIWNRYKDELSGWAGEGGVRFQTVPLECSHPAHLFALVMPSGETRSRFISHCAEQGVQAVFHYQPLHSSPFAVHNLPAQLDCPVSQELGDCLVRLPLFPGMTREQVDLVVDAVTSFRL